MEKILTRMMINRVDALYGINSCGDDTKLHVMVNDVNRAMKAEKEDAAYDWACLHGFDPEDKTVPASMFIGYMAFVDSRIKERRQLLMNLAHQLRIWGYPVKYCRVDDTLVISE